MKKAYLYALAAFAVLLISAVSVYAYEPDYGPAANCYTTGSCPAPAWDRTPIYIQAPNDPYLPPTCPVQAWQVDPWVKCGAFCAGGNVAPGWPYGWGSEYWLRPDTNF